MVQKSSLKPKLLIIAGPTCSGKSQLSINLAKKYNGEIISCDSMQIYKGCNIATAKIKSDEMQGVKHYMLDVVNPTEKFSVSEYKVMAEKCINDVLKMGKLPILVGGTGLYIEAIIKDFNFKNVGKSEIIRKKYQDFLQNHTKEELFDILKQKNIDMANKIDCNNVKRVIRALEVIELGYDGIEENRQSKYDYLYCVLNRDRIKLYQAINNRVDVMVNNGVVDEVQSLLSNGVTFENQCMQSIGYKEWQNYLQGSEDKSIVIEKIKQNTRRYAKRQLTWFKHRDNVVFYDVDSKEDMAQLEKNISSWLYNNN